jgi:hypothetical protein
MTAPSRTRTGGGVPIGFILAAMAGFEVAIVAAAAALHAGLLRG